MFEKTKINNKRPSKAHQENNAKPRDSLTAPICDHFAWVSLTIFGIFLLQWLKLKNIVCKSIAQDLEQVSLRKRFQGWVVQFKIICEPNFFSILLNVWPILQVPVSRSHQSNQVEIDHARKPSKHLSSQTLKFSHLKFLVCYKTILEESWKFQISPKAKTRRRIF